MIKEYIVKKTAKAFAKANNLRESPEQSGVYFDFSLLDSIKWDNNYEREMFEQDFMKHNSCCWYEQPLLTIIMYNQFEYYVGKTATNITRVFRKNGTRMMVIVELCNIELERQTRKTVYEKTLTTVQTYKAKSGYGQRSFDLEIA